MKGQKKSCFGCPAHGNSLFCQLPKAELEKIEEIKTTQLYRKGEMIFHQESPSYGLHCIDAGTVKLFTQEADGKEIIHRISKTGDLLGACSVFGNKSHFESAKALETVSCCFIDARQLKELFLAMPQLNEQFLLKMSQELLEANRRNTDMVRKNVRERLATYFIKMADSLGNGNEEITSFTPHLSREEIASYIGSAHETVIRCISEFKELGYIDEQNKTFYILNKERLMGLGSHA
jgi:CRP-like cAMP-binding protein